MKGSSSGWAACAEGARFDATKRAERRFGAQSTSVPLAQTHKPLPSQNNSFKRLRALLG
jgi:hypothetical protein